MLYKTFAAYQFVETVPSYSVIAMIINKGKQFALSCTYISREREEEARFT